MVLAHPAGLIHEYPNDAMFNFRARSERSSAASVAIVLAGERDGMNERLLLDVPPALRRARWLAAELSPAC